MSDHELAELNVARARAPLDSPVMADFMAALDRVNALAEASPGFVWRLRDEAGNATSIRVFDDPRIIVNLTVWTSPEALAGYAYRTGHVEVFRRRADWFERLDGPNLVLWWVPVGHRPTVAEATARLACLAAEGPGPSAFTLKVRFPAPAPPASPS